MQIKKCFHSRLARGTGVIHLLQTIFAKLNQSANPCMYAAIAPEMKSRYGRCFTMLFISWQ